VAHFTLEEHEKLTHILYPEHLNKNTALKAWAKWEYNLKMFLKEIM
jgi:hypothetical protein